MGTSMSHGGPKSGVLFDPPWLDEINDNPKVPEVPKQETHEPIVPQLLAPPARFKNARKYLGEYIKGGSNDSLKKALGHYSHTGMGGARNVAKRMRHSASIASKLYSVFSLLREGNEPTLSSIIIKYRTETTDLYGMIEAIARYVCGDGGSLDETSPIKSVSLALSDLLNKDPAIDITNLSDDYVWSLISSFLSYEAFNRVQLDLGKNSKENKIPIDDRITRLKYMREYLESEISTQINTIRGKITEKNPTDLRSVMMTAIERTFKVFEVAV